MAPCNFSESSLKVIQSFFFLIFKSMNFCFMQTIRKLDNATSGRLKWTYSEFQFRSNDFTKNIIIITTFVEWAYTCLLFIRRSIFGLWWLNVSIIQFQMLLAGNSFWNFNVTPHRLVRKSFEVPFSSSILYLHLYHYYFSTLLLFWIIQIVLHSRLFT